ncbi:hypothetical protein BWQ96_02810 [Gracilariopsis chorda]|uniref:Uncharacterized protein n=1 Tax=Gracilariopsis chorda TaxID=448386 RepID=A0A2V3IZG2_9FLOR|nr:hypothetical protein BWQ96_02810 [Gracilariopsis chorda]|eukprot:PXF47479.1 hypothetical protein BWQ96_02810 [Gracilariopsis chorda]
MPASDDQSARGESEPPNVALAYPPRSNPAARLLPLVMLFGAIVALIVHRSDLLTKTAVINKLNNITSTSNAAASPATLAVCYSGHLGTFPHVFHQNLDAIRSFDKNAHIFFFVDPKDDYHHERSGHRYVEEHDMGLIQPMFDAMKAKVVRTFSTEAITVPKASQCYMRENSESNHYSKYYMQFYAANECYKMIETEEQASGKQYKWILRLQPNMQIRLKSIPEDAEPRVHMSGNAIALIPRQMADDFFSVVQAFEPGKCKPLDQLGGAPCEKYSYEHWTPECLQIKWLSMTHIIPSNGAYVNRKIIYPTPPDIPNE